jgi:hypothetical protein
MRFESQLIWLAFPLWHRPDTVGIASIVLRGLHAGDLGEAFPVLLLPAAVALTVIVFGISTLFPRFAWRRGPRHDRGL